MIARCAAEAVVLVVQALRVHAEEPEVQKQAIMAVQGLVLIQGETPEALQGLESLGYLDALERALRLWPGEAQLEEQGLATVRTFACRGRPGMLLKLIEMGFVESALATMQLHFYRAQLEESGCAFLAEVAWLGNGHNDRLGQQGACQVVIKALSALAKEQRVQAMGCAALQALCCDCEANRVLAVRHSGIDCIFQAMTNFPHAEEVQAFALAAAYSITHTLRERQVLFIELGGIRVAQSALLTHFRSARVQEFGKLLLDKIN